MSEEQARSSFNNLMERQNGVLSHRPAEFAQEHHRRWLVTAYEAGDVVLHKPHMVSPHRGNQKLVLVMTGNIDPCLHRELRP